jgi:CheY-like chemotaxis protein
MPGSVRVLLVEDNPGDADLTRASLATSSVGIDLTVVADGTEALDFIHRRGRFAGAPRPDLVLLDLNVPGVDGHRILAEIKRDPEMKRTPVSILTSSAAEGDVAKSYDLGANCYVVKPFDFQSHQKIVRAVENFWFAIVKLPPRRDGARVPEKADSSPGLSARCSE